MVESEVGRGSTFTIRLPRIVEATKAVEKGCCLLHLLRSPFGTNCKYRAGVLTTAIE
jgi:hypothetical protein